MNEYGKMRAFCSWQNARKALAALTFWNACKEPEKKNVKKSKINC